MLAAVRDEVSSALVLRGQPGIGKTALLDWTVERAPDMRVARVVGVESEMDLGFAGLHQLLGPFLDGIDQLPEPQRDALGGAFGLVANTAPDQFRVGLATLTLLSEAAARRPVLCVIDDAQWVDRVSLEVLGFMARRLLADRVGMVFAVRDGERPAVPLDGLPQLGVGPLPEEAAIELLTASAGQPLDPMVGKRIVAQTAGNPLVLLEYGGELTEAEASGTAPLAEPLRFSGRVEELYRSRVQALPAAAQKLLVLAAADQLGDPATVWRAAAKLGIDQEAGELPAVDRLVSWEPRIQFRHPLMRSAAYYAAPASVRRRVHEALALASDPDRDPDRRAWHLAAAAVSPDEGVAAELERSADRARGRGGWASGAVFLERAAALTPDAGRRAGRLLEAAEARYMAGEASTAHDLLQRARPRLLDPLARGKARRLLGLTLHATGELSQATSALIEAAAIIEPHDVRLARDTLLDALTAAYFSGPAADGGVARVLRTVKPLPAAEQSRALLTDLLLDGFAAVAEQRYEAGFSLLRRAIEPLSSEQPLPDDLLQRFLPMSMAVSLLFDESAWLALERRWVAELRGRGALAVMLVALVSLAYNQLTEGRFADAEVTLVEGRELSEATGFRSHLGLFECARLQSLACRGHEAEARALARRLLRDFAAAGHALGAHWVRVALCQLEIGLGNYEEALRVALENRSSAVSVVDIIEAGTRSGDWGAAATAMDAFTPVAVAAGTHVSLGWLALGRALLAPEKAAEEQYRLAIDHLLGSRHVPMLARSRLLYGEWLRRQRRRRDAREQLETAWQMFTRLGMEAFAERARTELRATGEHARKRTVQAYEELTPQEAQIAGMVTDGATNAEIAARLFISASTVEYHLRKVFRKLGVTSRVKLAVAIRERAESAELATQ
jgi:DNA-binding CsgD family transcriptional regulator